MGKYTFPTEGPEWFSEEDLEQMRNDFEDVIDEEEPEDEVLELNDPDVDIDYDLEE